MVIHTAVFPVVWFLYWLKVIIFTSKFSDAKMFVSVQSLRQDVSPNPALINSVGIKASVSPDNGVNAILSRTSAKNTDQATNILDWVEMLVEDSLERGERTWLVLWHFLF